MSPSDLMLSGIDFHASNPTNQVEKLALVPLLCRMMSSIVNDRSIINRITLTKPQVLNSPNIDPQKFYGDFILAMLFKQRCL